MISWLRENERWCAWLVAAVALAVHLVCLWESRADPTSSHPIVDARNYDQEARRILAATPGRRIPFWQPPLYPYWLAAAYALTGGGMTAARVLQAVLGAATCGMVFGLGRRLFGRGVGLAAGLITALYGPLVFFDLQLLPVSLAAFLDVAALWLLVRALASGRARDWLAGGVVTGVSALAVPLVLVLVPLVAVLLAWRRLRGEDGSWRRALAVFVLGVVAAIAPVTVRNAVVAGEFVPISTNGGINLYIGNSGDRAAWAIRPGVEWDDLVRLPVREGVTTSSGADTYFRNKALREAAAHPGAFLRGIAYKTLLYLGARELPRNVDVYVHRAWSSLLGLLVWRVGWWGFPFGVVGPLAVVGLAAACRRDSEGRLLVSLFLLLYSAAVVLFFVTARYRVVMAPLFALFAAAGADWLARQARSPARLVTGLALLAAAGAAAALPLRAPTDDIDFESELHLMLGINAAEEGRPGDAERAYRSALAVQPAYAEAHYNLGSLFMEQGRTDEALAEYREALRIRPAYAEAHNNAGLALAARGDLEGALRAFRAALEIKPYLAKTHHNIGKLFLQRGRVPEAVASFREAIRWDGFEYEACNDLAWILATHPDAAFRNGSEAVALAERAYREAPALTGSMLDTLAAAYAEAGRFSEAVACGERAAERAGEEGDRGFAGEVTRRVAGYRDAKPYRDKQLLSRERTP